MLPFAVPLINQPVASTPPPPPPPRFNIFGYGANVSGAGASGSFYGPYVESSNGVDPISYSFAGGGAKMSTAGNSGPNGLISYSGFGVGESQTIYVNVSATDATGASANAVGLPVTYTRTA